MGLSIWHLLVLLLVIFVLFGAGKLPRMMGDIGRGVRSLKQGLKGEESEERGADAKLVAEEAVEEKPKPRKKKSA